MGTAKPHSIEAFKHNLLYATQNKYYGNKLWHNNFSSNGRTRYWTTLFSHCGDFGGVLNWKQ